MKRKWKFLKSFLPLTRQLLNSAYFQFNDQFYKQILCDPMGFCTSLLFAEIALEYLEIQCLKKLKSSILFHKSYVDDSFLIVKSNKIQHALYVFNSYNENVQFTVEYEDNNSSINFYEMKITRINKKVPTDWYMKSIASGRCMHYMSHHPLSQKKAIIYNSN